MYTKSHIFRMLLLISMMWSFCSCSKDDDPNESFPKDVAIAFDSAIKDDAEQTRAAMSYTLGKNFRVWGYKKTDDWHNVFNEYLVNYDKGEYLYDGVTEGQYIKFWDYSASEYRYWAISGNYDKVSDSKFELAVDLSDLSSVPMFSEQNVINYAGGDYGKIVKMQFCRPYCMVRYKFIPATNVTLSELRIKNDKFAPTSSSDHIYTSGKFTVSYSLSGDATYNTTGNAKITDDCITPNSEDYTVVMPAPDGQSSYKMTANILDEDREAVVPSQYMKWMPNTKYTYIFKVTDNTIEFYDVNIDPWKYGGSQDGEWNNW